MELCASGGSAAASAAGSAAAAAVGAGVSKRFASLRMITWMHVIAASADAPVAAIMSTVQIVIVVWSYLPTLSSCLHVRAQRRPLGG